MQLLSSFGLLKHLPSFLPSVYSFHQHVKKEIVHFSKVISTTTASHKKKKQLSFGEDMSSDSEVQGKGKKEIELYMQRESSPTYF